MEEAEELMQAVEAIVTKGAPEIEEMKQELEEDVKEEKIEQEEQEFVERKDEEEEELEEQEQEQEEHVPENKLSQKVVPRGSAIVMAPQQNETSKPPATLVQDAAKQCFEERVSYEESIVLPEPLETIDNFSQIYAHAIPAKKPKEKHTKKPTQNGESLQQNKLIKQIFTHFCKENYISSIKSTLFEDKQKVMEEMSLNKWMVFCKEFDIFTQLCFFKIHKRKKVTEETQGMQSSQIREQIRVKQVKQVQKSLSTIFKKSTENHTKMQYQHFVAAIRLLKEEFNHQNSEFSLETDLDFAKKYLHCESQHQCLKKLSNLKFTFGIPQIEYMKLPVFQGTDKSKSRFKLTETKENCNDLDTSKKYKNLSSNESRTMLLNPIIKEAKNVLSTPENKASIASMRKHGAKLKLVPDQPKRDKHPKTKTQKDPLHSDLLKYFDESKDEILESYFKVEKLASVQK